VDLIDGLAQADEHELVKTFQEVNAAYFPLNSDALSLQLDSCVAFSREEHSALVQRVRAVSFLRMHQLLADCCVDGKCPPIVALPADDTLSALL